MKGGAPATSPAVGIFPRIKLFSRLIGRYSAGPVSERGRQEMLPSHEWLECRTKNSTREEQKYPTFRLSHLTAWQDWSCQGEVRSGHLPEPERLCQRQDYSPRDNSPRNNSPTDNLSKNKNKQGSGAEDSVGPHSGRPVLLWPTMKIWIVCFHF